MPSSTPSEEKKIAHTKKYTSGTRGTSRMLLRLSFLTKPNDIRLHSARIEVITRAGEMAEKFIGRKK